MDKSKKSQILKLSLLASLFFITPLLSSSLRPPYLYFIINLLIIALSIDDGLLSSFSKPTNSDYQDKKSFLVSTAQAYPDHIKENPIINESTEKKAKVVEKSASEKIVTGAVKKMDQKVKKSSSMPSLFFIGNGESTEKEEEFVEDDDYELEGEEVGGGLSGQELFTRAENFIGGFYKQLKMQREESWQRLQDLCHKAF